MNPFLFFSLFSFNYSFIFQRVAEVTNINYHNSLAKTQENLRKLATRKNKTLATMKTLACAVEIHVQNNFIHKNFGVIWCSAHPLHSHIDTIV